MENCWVKFDKSETMSESDESGRNWLAIDVMLFRDKKNCCDEIRRMAIGNIKKKRMNEL